MYRILISSNKTEKRLKEYMAWRGDIASKLDRLKIDPRRECGAHPLRGRLSGKWAAWLGSNIRLIYTIDDVTKVMLVEAVGTHTVY